MRYSFGFDEDLQQEWEWTERYAAQPEILGYLNHVADRFDLRRSIVFNTRVTAAHFDETTARWGIETDQAGTISVTYCVMATGCLSAARNRGSVDCGASTETCTGQRAGRANRSISPDAGSV